ncbi:hypothetical protein ACFL6H_02150 [Candidatus Latescibacterota bacterium]
MKKLMFYLITGCMLFSFTAHSADMPNYTSRVYPGQDGRLIYIPDEQGNIIPDFSHAGYNGGGVPLPFVAAKETLWAVEGDAAPMIQSAIDRVAALPLDEHGFRGAVLLQMGYYELHSPLKIAASGVVLRGDGMGQTGTILIGVDAEEMSYNNRNDSNLIEVGGVSAWEPDEKTMTQIANSFVPVGARSFRVKSANGYKTGDTVLVRRHGNQEWIHELGQDLENEQWRWEPFTMQWDRIVTAVDGNTITVDAPITFAIDSQWGGGEIVKYTSPGRISNVGIENLRGMSDYDQAVRRTDYGNIDRSPYIGEEYYSDENHYWNFIAIDNIENAWVRNITALHFGRSAVSTRSGAKWITVQDCVSLEPVSLRHGGRRFTFQIGGQLTLIQRCFSEKGRHSFVLGGRGACGPNVFLDCSVTIPYNSSEPHGGFVTGSLFDNVQAPLTARFWKEISIGWAGANTVFWNCEGPFLIQKPPTAQNYSFGHIGIHATVYNTRYQDLTKEDGYIESWDKHVDPRSLYLTQLRDRLGEQAVRAIAEPEQMK